MTSDDEDLDPSLFQEPAGYLKEQPTEKKQTSYTLLDGTILNLQLIAYDTLWSNYIWNAGRVLAQHFERHPDLITSKSTLELGCGAALPSLVAALKGASPVTVVTDYPDPHVLSNLRDNVAAQGNLLLGRDVKVHVRGLCWGDQVAISDIKNLDPSTRDGFGVLVLADLLFNHSEHAKMMGTVAATLKICAESRAYVFFTPYRPWLLQKDLGFFDLAGGNGLLVEDLGCVLLESAMEEFKDDRGDETLRRTVFRYCMRWSDEVLQEKERDA